MGYEMDMSNEKKPSRKVLLPEGWREFKIKDMEETMSKSGNNMFIITVTDTKTGNDDTWYSVAEPKKRWFLKSILSACDCAGGEDGVYKWDKSDVIGKKVAGLVEHEDNKWINRDGEEITTKQHRVVDIDVVDNKISWDD